MGRRLKFRSDCPLGTWCDVEGSDYETQPNNRLLVSIAQAFGVELVDYGNQPLAEFASGTLPGFSS
jgi:hypothetical protein